MIHDLSGLQEDNMVYWLGSVVSRAVFLSQYHFLRQLRDVSSKESRLDSK